MRVCKSVEDKHLASVNKPCCSQLLWVPSTNTRPYLFTLLALPARVRSGLCLHATT